MRKPDAPFTLAIASGKGGTGKTTVATNLAVSASRAGAAIQLLDCDVEEPNSHLFLRPAIEQTTDATVLVPIVDAARCNACGKCAEFCRYNALARVRGTVVVFNELCHSCGGCEFVCPLHAIHEEPRVIGKVEQGHADAVRFGHGVLNLGEVRAVPLVQQVRALADPAMDAVILDAPPGTSCAMISAVEDCDFALLVTEPTPFGQHDLELAVETVRKLGLPAGVVVNRADDGMTQIREYCARADVPILMELPQSRAIAEAYSTGILAIDALPRLQQQFADLLTRIRSGATAKGVQA